MISEFKIGVVQCVSTVFKFSNVLTVKTFQGQMIGFFFLDILLTEENTKSRNMEVVFVAEHFFSDII